MKTPRLLALLALSFSHLAAADAPPPPAYPLNECVVSGEALGSMGKPHEHVHKEAGKPDRLVKFCCKMCLPRFEKDPAKYLAKLDAAAPAPTAKPPAPAACH